MHIYLFVVICAANLFFRAGNLCSASKINLYDSSSSDGWLESTGYWWDSPYTWIITAPYGQKVLLNFDRLRLSYSYYCQSNYLEVRDGQYSYSPLLTKQCYSSNPPSPIYSEGRYLYVKFSSRYNSDGISATFRALNDSATGCPKVLKGNNTGVIYSPGFPFGYSDSVDCSWVISGKFYYSYLLLNFTVFDLESGCYDKVVVRDGRYSWSSRLGQYCSDNSQAPFVVTPSGSIARVEFTSDWGGSEKGFLMFYKILDSPYTPTRAPTTYPWWRPTTYPWWPQTTYPWYTSWRKPTPHLDSTSHTLAIALPLVIGFVLLVIIITIVLCERSKRAASVITAPPLAIPLQTFPQQIPVSSTTVPAQQRVSPAIGVPTAPLTNSLLSPDELQVEFSGPSSGAEMTQSPHNDALVANVSDQPSSQSRQTPEEPFQVEGENYYAPSPL